MAIAAKEKMAGAVLTAVLALSGANVSALMVDTIKPVELSTLVSCSATSAFLDANACVGMVIDPNNDTAGNANTSILVTYLNGGDITIGQGQSAVTEAGYIGTSDLLNPWGTKGSWTGIPAEIQSTGIPGSSGILSVTKDAGTLKSGSFTFDSTSLGKYIDQFVINVKGASGWSSYYYDLTGLTLSSFTNTWDTKGLVTNPQNLNTPDISHIYGAYILGDDISTDPPEPMPLPGTLLLVGLGLLGVRFARKA